MEHVAFYLTQYHSIPENDAVYGAGFTEWDNVRRAVPLFAGHYEPHVPHPAIGYYNLLDEKFLAVQHALAYDHGVGAFCYYYYDFAGRRLLEKPLDLICASRRIRNRFCLCWAHESWYDNRKTGARKSVFLPQEYSEAAARRLCANVLPYLEHPRAITVGGRPLFLIWSPERVPGIAMYADILREGAQKRGFPGLCLAGVEAHAGVDPAALGLDIMVEFAPNWLVENHVSAPGERPVRIDYAATLRFMLEKPVPPYTRLRCTFPGWDNTPRRGRGGIACTGQNPELFRIAIDFLHAYTKKVLPPSLQYVFINAWNEWGEGAHIEPDARYGFKYLEIVRDSLRGGHYFTRP